MIGPAKKMMRLFPGLTRAHGQFNPTDNSHRFVHEPLILERYIDHIEGKAALGVVPINEDNKAKSGSLDIDEHKKDKTKEPEPWTKEQYNKLTDKIKFLKLPLTVFKSKSGGAHCHLFLDSWVSAKVVQDIMKVFEYALCYEGLEIFPKQTTLKPEDSGSFINLPYFNGNSRVCVNFDNEELNLDEGLDYSIKRTVKLKNYLKYFLLKQGSRTQHRNDRTWCAAAFLKKQYPDQWEQKTKEYNQLFNEPPLEAEELERTIFKSHRNKEYNKQEDNQEEPPQDFFEGAEEFEDFQFNNSAGSTEHDPRTTDQKELIGYDMKEYRKLDIEPKSFIIKNLLFDKSFNFIVGPKGTGKSEFVIGMCTSISRGHDFLGRTISCCTPVVYIDAEMYPTDPIDREAPYLKRWGDAPDNYFHMLNFSFQKNQQFPDLVSEHGQQLIKNYLIKVERLTGKKPLLVLDNLRSLSAYKENDSDAWYPIGKFLFKLRGSGFSSIVIDHMGKMSPGPRGSSSKTDWADLVLILTPEKREKGSKVMKVKVVFDKARGLRPENTDEFFAQYDFQGEWSVAQGKVEMDQEETFVEIDKIIREWQNNSNKKELPTQQYISDKLKMAVGKVNGLMKKFAEWEKSQNVF